MKSLAKQHSIDVPLAALSDKQAASSFIESASKARASAPNVQSGEVQPVTERQVSFATRLLTERGLGQLPKEAMENRVAMSAFITTLLNSPRTGDARTAPPAHASGDTMEAPTEKQVRARATALVPA